MSFGAARPCDGRNVLGFNVHEGDIVPGALQEHAGGAAEGTRPQIKIRSGIPVSLVYLRSVCRPSSSPPSSWRTTFTQ